MSSRTFEHFILALVGLALLIAWHALPNGPSVERTSRGAVSSSFTEADIPSVQRWHFVRPVVNVSGRDIFAGPPPVVWEGPRQPPSRPKPKKRPKKPLVPLPPPPPPVAVASASAPEPLPFGHEFVGFIGPREDSFAILVDEQQRYSYARSGELVDGQFRVERVGRIALQVTCTRGECAGESRRVLIARAQPVKGGKRRG